MTMVVLLLCLTATAAPPNDAPPPATVIAPPPVSEERALNGVSDPSGEGQRRSHRRHRWVRVGAEHRFQHRSLVFWFVRLPVHARDRTGNRRHAGAAAAIAVSRL